MTKILVAGLLSFGLAFTLPVSAAGKKKAPRKRPRKIGDKVEGKSQDHCESQRKPAARREHPTSERYTEIEQALVERGYLRKPNGNWDTDSVEALKKISAGPAPSL